MRSFLLGFLLLIAFSVTVLSLRPGGLRQQLRLVARRFRIALVLGGVYIAVGTVLRLLFTSGPVADWGSPVLALVLTAAFLVVARDPQQPSAGPQAARRQS